ncbi:MAG: DUF5631 domain-containing protein [Mycobacterium sp.]|uniref:DUF5631 domain-containing protein n=1 Tax=Mycobacterium sp. TaxID=1785 RepID=UPI001EBDCF3D|nr:DUF5631 domain-containing protein [Mycobacterium sp.]MBV8787203.1 DUF5631 domain-containing protein [Mycobacterium sp.]
MAIFGRMTARQRLRRATRESLAIPAFSSPIDCTPWVTGGLWPAELSTVSGETASLADYLRTDLQRIAQGANDELKMLKRSEMPDPARQAAEARIIEQARARAVRRVESTMRQLREMKAKAASGYRRPPAVEPVARNFDATQVMPAITDEIPVDSAPAQARDYDEAAAAELEETQILPVIRDSDQATSGRHHAVDDDDEPETTWIEAVPDEDVAPAELEETQIIPVIRDVDPSPVAPVETAPGPPTLTTDSGRHHAIVDEPPAQHEEPEAAAVAAATQRIEKPVAATESDIDRLSRILEFVVRQEPRLHWAVGDRVDGATLLVTDLAHGWVPSGITLPAGVRLLEPEQRTGRVSALIGDTARVVTYAPGDSLRRSPNLAATKSSLQPRELPVIEDLGRVLSEAIRWRNGLPQIVQRLAQAVAAGVAVVDQEVDVLRVHLDTARYHLLVQYPAVNSALLLNCLLLAATEGISSGDAVSANYHLAWYQKLIASNMN